MYCKGSGEKGPYIQGRPENEGGVPSISSSSVHWPIRWGLFHCLEPDKTHDGFVKKGGIVRLSTRRQVANSVEMKRCQNR
jgi:hypothetical protein